VSLTSLFAASLAALPRAPGEGVAIAFSGGLDSSALLHLVHAWSRTAAPAVPPAPAAASLAAPAPCAPRLYAFHVHHGLSPNADAWLAHCERECAALGITFACRRITLGDNSSGTEAAARKSRYAALGAMCAEHHVRLLLTAHHQDDQAETILLQLLRGSGPAGLSGMDTANRAPTLLGSADILLARPLLTASRAELEQYVRDHVIAHIEDESNADQRYARNALRHSVMPQFEQAFPGYQDRFARSARHAQSAQHLLDELAADDLRASLRPAVSGNEPSDPRASLDLARLRAMSEDRCNNLLRHWFAQRSVRLPSTSWLAEMREQALTARDDANLRVTHPDCEVRRHRDRLYLVPRRAALPDTDQHFQWDGETQIAFPAFSGVLHFDLAPDGLDPDWLRQQMLSLGRRKGGERLKPAANRPTRDLKHHYQSLGIPAWERDRAAIVSIPGQLLYASGIGMDCHKMTLGQGARIVFRWEAE
jgi:tRNA(Ile)-lysidine synthase